MLSKLIK